METEEKEISGGMEENVNHPEGKKEDAQNNDSADWQKRVEVLEKELAQARDQHIRLLAEFDNFRKRTAREKSDLIRTASEDVMLALLPVLDDFERTIVASEKTENLASIREGIRLVTGNFFKALTKKGLEQIVSVGSDFDSGLHEAITSVSMGEEKAGKVVDEVEKGYKLGDKVIRYAKVIVGE